MNVRTCVLIVIIGFLTISANTNEPRYTVGINPGDRAPGIKSLGNESDLSFQNHSGRYTLLCFWAAYDADSRVRNVQLSKEVNKWDSDKIVMYSVSCDKSEAVFEGTMRTDNLSGTKQFNEPDSKSALYRQYKMDRGLKAYLINDKGVIVAVNLPPQKLAAYLERN